jgi:uncharacterized membrane protein YgdD (TMEM256/DUF423 family)
MERFFFGLGALLAGVAVIAGAYGAHSAETSLSPEQATWISKAARYQMYHGLALLAVAWACVQWPDQMGIFRISGFLFLAGTICFSGSLYLMAFTDIRLGYMTPLGGLAFIAGWLAMVIGAWR